MGVVSAVLLCGVGQMDPLFTEKFIVRELLRAVNHEKIIPKRIRAHR